MAGDNIRRTVHIFDGKKSVSVDFRDGRVADGIGDRIDGGDFEDADAAYLNGAGDVVNIRQNRDRGSIRG